VVGEIGITNYNELTFVDVMQIIEGYNDRVIQSYKQTRLLMFTMARLLGDSKKVPSTVEEFWTLPGDEVSATANEDQMKAIFDNLKKAKNE
jgi:hypothetical protein